MALIQWLEAFGPKMFAWAEGFIDRLSSLIRQGRFDSLKENWLKYALILMLSGFVIDQLLYFARYGKQTLVVRLWRALWRACMRLRRDAPEARQPQPVPQQEGLYNEWAAQGTPQGQEKSARRSSLAQAAAGLWGRASQACAGLAGRLFPRRRQEEPWDEESDWQEEEWYDEVVPGGDGDEVYDPEPEVADWADGAYEDAPEQPEDALNRPEDWAEVEPLPTRQVEEAPPVEPAEMQEPPQAWPQPAPDDPFIPEVEAVPAPLPEQPVPGQEEPEEPYDEWAAQASPEPEPVQPPRADGEPDGGASDAPFIPQETVPQWEEPEGAMEAERQRAQEPLVRPAPSWAEEAAGPVDWGLPEGEADAAADRTPEDGAARRVRISRGVDPTALDASPLDADGLRVTAQLEEEPPAPEEKKKDV